MKIFVSQQKNLVRGPLCCFLITYCTLWPNKIFVQVFHRQLRNPHARQDEWRQSDACSSLTTSLSRDQNADRLGNCVQNMPVLLRASLLLWNGHVLPGYLDVAAENDCGPGRNLSKAYILPVSAVLTDFVWEWIDSNCVGRPSLGCSLPTSAHVQKLRNVSQGCREVLWGRKSFGWFAKCESEFLLFQLKVEYWKFERESCHLTFKRPRNSFYM